MAQQTVAAAEEKESSLVERQYVSQRDSGRYMQPRGEAVCKSEGRWEVHAASWRGSM